MLRTRSFLIFLGVTIFLAVSALVIARYTLVYQLDRLEKRAAEEVLRTIRAGLDIELRKLVRTTSDWAFWDLSTGSVTVSVRRVHLEAPKVGYETIPPGRYIAVRVQDTGKGIPEKDLPHIFEPFYTNKKMGQSGTGLGMTIIWHAVKDMQGYIDVASRPDHGTTFTVYLPEMEPPNHAQSLPAHHGIPRGSGERILVVEDMEDQRVLVKALLTDLGYRVETAANSREALQRVTADRFDALVLDMILEEDGLDGAAVYREVLKVNPDQKALVVSGDVSADRVAAVTALGVSHFVSKPYTVEKLASALHAVLHEDEQKPICL
uniref:histidine kinase n=1 Tax=Desulfacinum infernum TaxID=35837 RepID=A0A832A4X2_9BACT